MGTMRVTSDFSLLAAILASFLTLACSAEDGVEPKELVMPSAPAAGLAGAPRAGTTLSPQGFGVDSFTRGVQLKWPGEPGSEYVVLWTNDIADPEWEEVGRLFCRFFQELSFFENARPDRQGFYRIEKARPMVVVPGCDGGGVDYDFYIGKYEVTNAEFAVFLSANPSYQWTYWPDLQQGRVKIRQLASKTLYIFIPVPGWEDHPITAVSWEMAAAYCNWLSEREGLDKVYDESAGWVPDIARNGCRLPMSEEWYKAAAWDPTKDGVGGFWKYGCRSDIMGNTLANHDDGGDPYGYDGWYPSSHERDPETTPVGYYDGSSHFLYRDGQASYSFITEDARSYYGCYDMSGNVDEVVNIVEFWGAGIMGSSWGDKPYEAKIGPAFPIPPNGQADVQGFRIARTAK